LFPDIPGSNDGHVHLKKLLIVLLCFYHHAEKNPGEISLGQTGVKVKVVYC
jgi:hypothetical protein